MSRLKMPTWTVMRWLGMSISSTLFMRPISMTTAPSRASEPPLRLVPQPRGTNGMPSSARTLSTAETCSVESHEDHGPRYGPLQIGVVFVGLEVDEPVEHVLRPDDGPQLAPPSGAAHGRNSRQCSSSSA